MPRIRTRQLGTSCARCAHVITAEAMPLIEREGTSLTCPRCSSAVPMPSWAEINEDDTVAVLGPGDRAAGGKKFAVQMEQRRRRAQRLVIGSLVLIILILLPRMLFPVYGPADVRSDEWDGMSQFIGDMEAVGREVVTLETSTHLMTNSNLVNASRTLLIVAGAQRTLSWTEHAGLRSFLDSGGGMIVADDFGHGNHVLYGGGRPKAEDLNASHSRTENQLPVFSGEVLVDVHNDGSPSLVTVEVEGPAELDGRFYTLQFNRPSAFVTADELDPYHVPPHTVALSSEESWLDLDADRARDPGEVQGPWPMVVITGRIPSNHRWTEPAQGGGIITAISDPSIFINEMYPLGDNRAFILDLINLLYGDRIDRVVIFTGLQYRQTWMAPAWGLIWTAGNIMLAPASLLGFWFDNSFWNICSLMGYFGLVLIISMIWATKLPGMGGLGKRSRDQLGALNIIFSGPGELGPGDQVRLEEALRIRFQSLARKLPPDRRVGQTDASLKALGLAQLAALVGGEEMKTRLESLWARDHAELVAIVESWGVDYVPEP